MILGCAFSVLFSGEPGVFVSFFLILVFAMPLLLLGSVYLLSAMAKIHLVPQGIAVTLFDKTVRQYPVERIGAFFGVEWWEKGWGRMLGISLHTPEELTALRERQLQKGLFTRDELKFRKRREDWQCVFRMEYLLKRAKLHHLTGWKRDILWMNLNPDTVALLRTIYPEVPWEYLRMKDHLGMDSPWEDKNPTRFPRSRGAESESDRVLLLFMGLFLGAMLAVVVLVDGCETLLLLVGLFALIFGLLYYDSLGESDVFYLSHSGIRIMRGKKEHSVMFAEEIRTILKCESLHSNTYSVGPSLMISTVETGDLIQRELTASGSAYASLAVRIPDWEKRVLLRGCYRQKRSAKAKDSDCQLLAWNVQREQTLRELFPNAQWIDLTMEAMYP